MLNALLLDFEFNLPGHVSCEAIDLIESILSPENCSFASLEMFLLEKYMQ